MIDLGGDVTGNGISKLVFTILSAVAEAECEPDQRAGCYGQSRSEGTPTLAWRKGPARRPVRRAWHPATGSGAASGNYHGAANAGGRCQAPHHSRDLARAVRVAAFDGRAAQYRCRLDPDHQRRIQPCRVGSLKVECLAAFVADDGGSRAIISYNFHSHKRLLRPLHIRRGKGIAKLSRFTPTSAVGRFFLTQLRICQNDLRLTHPLLLV
jgi:hypothetical protein